MRDETITGKAVSSLYRCVVFGPVATKKNSPRMARNPRTGRVFPLPSAASCKWAFNAVPVMQRAGALWLARPVNVRATIWRQRAVGDLLNYEQAIADALQAAGVVADDKWIMGWDGSRMYRDPLHPRVEIEIEELAT